MSRELVEGAWRRRAGEEGHAIFWVLHRRWRGVGQVRTSSAEGADPLPGAQGPFLVREKPLEKAREASWRLGLEVETGTLNV